MTITTLHQIEITSRCNLRCKYCVHPKMSRAKLDMDRETFRAALRWAERFSLAGTQKELNLAGIGESTMHPDFIEYVALAREAVGPSVHLILATNGLLMTEELAKALVRYRPKIWVSLHRPERAKPAVDILKSYGLLSGVSVDPSLAAIDWAGQVDWHVSSPKIHCAWIAEQRAFVTADGRVMSCCLDGRKESQGELHPNIKEADLAKLNVRPYDLCQTCSYFTPELRASLGVPASKEGAAIA